MLDELAHLVCLGNRTARVVSVVKLENNYMGIAIDKRNYAVYHIAVLLLYELDFDK